ncbi:SDR family oxidoreductase [Ramlibacter sp. PS3R-8]|uniref:SDR family oxidoreductase n=1 Tax=Ramlibacter sp. PS3R-8 TaxID=3133437 RepID=UPI0030A15155
MKIVVIGGTGLIGSRLVQRLRTSGHEAVAASPNTGVNTLTGEGLDAALAGADVVVDVANSPSFEDNAVLSFFQKSGSNLLAAETRAGVRHHVALSVVGTARLQQSGYFRAKQVQEDLIRAGGIPYSILQATQFFEFVAAIAQSVGDGPVVRASSASIQPIAADDVADAMRDIALGLPLNGTVEIAGPERMTMSELVRRFFRAKGDDREVIADPAAPYFGAVLEPGTLVPAGGARLGAARLDPWLASAT